MKTPIISIGLYRFTSPGTKPHYLIVLEWNGCASVKLAGPFAVKREAERAYKRMTRVATSNHGAWRMDGSLFPVLEMVELSILNSVKKRGR